MKLWNNGGSLGYILTARAVSDDDLSTVIDKAASPVIVWKFKGKVWVIPILDLIMPIRTRIRIIHHWAFDYTQSDLRACILSFGFLFFSLYFCWYLSPITRKLIRKWYNDGSIR